MDYTLAYLNSDNAADTYPFQWEESLDPDGNEVTYYYIASHFPNMSEIIAEPFEYQSNINVANGELALSYMESNNLNESVFYWDIIASDGVFEKTSTNGPFMWYAYIGEDPKQNEETYLDLFISDWYIGYRAVSYTHLTLPTRS